MQADLCRISTVPAHSHQKRSSPNKQPQPLSQPNTYSLPRSTSEVSTILQPRTSNLLFQSTIATPPFSESNGSTTRPQTCASPRKQPQVKPLKLCQITRLISPPHYHAMTFAKQRGSSDVPKQISKSVSLLRQTGSKPKPMKRVGFI